VAETMEPSGEEEIVVGPAETVAAGLGDRPADDSSEAGLEAPRHIFGTFPSRSGLASANAAALLAAAQ